jgi:hypothetical protein
MSQVPSDHVGDEAAGESRIASNQLLPIAIPIFGEVGRFL